MITHPSSPRALVASQFLKHKKRLPLSSPSPVYFFVDAMLCRGKVADVRQRAAQAEAEAEKLEEQKRPFALKLKSSCGVCQESRAAHPAEADLGGFASPGVRA